MQTDSAVQTRRIKNPYLHAVKIQDCDIRQCADCFQRDSNFESALRIKICRQPVLFRKIVSIVCIENLASNLLKPANKDYVVILSHKTMEISFDNVIRWDLRISILSRGVA